MSYARGTRSRFSPPSKAADPDEFLMHRRLTISSEPIDERSLAAQRACAPGAGAAVYFLGLVRDLEDSSRISASDYEAFVPMAEHQFNLLLDEAERRWPLESIRL